MSVAEQPESRDRGHGPVSRSTLACRYAHGKEYERSTARGSDARAYAVGIVIQINASEPESGRHMSDTDQGQDR